MTAAVRAGQVILTPAEVHMAAQVGIRRQIEAIRQKRPDRNGYEGDGWSIHIQGAAGELAVAKLLGWYWDGSVNTFRTSPDVGALEVRTRSNHAYELYIRRDDDPTKAYVLVTGHAPYFWVHGWFRGADARRPEWWHNHGGRPYAWFVPTAELSPMEGLS